MRGLMENKFCKISTLFAALGWVSVYPCVAQTTENAAQGASSLTTMEYAAEAPPAGVTSSEPEGRTEVAAGTAVSGTDIHPALTKELEAMKQRIAELEAEIRSSGATAADAATALQGAKTNLATPDALQSGTRQAAPVVATQ